MERVTKTAHRFQVLATMTARWLQLWLGDVTICGSSVGCGWLVAVAFAVGHCFDCLYDCVWWLVIGGWWQLCLTAWL